MVCQDPHRTEGNKILEAYDRIAPLMDQWGGSALVGLDGLRLVEVFTINIATGLARPDRVWEVLWLRTSP
jgi:hypothetical protein